MDHQDKIMSSEDSRDLALSPSVEFFPQLMENSACEQQQESHCAISFLKDIISNPVSAEDGTQAQSSDCHRSRGSLIGSSMKKLSSLEEIRSHEKEPSVTGQLIGPASVNIGDALVTAAEDGIRAVSPFLEVETMR